MSVLKPKFYTDETGIVSILVVSILTITLSLIAIGFSKLADRELRQASDRELSSQAYYAAQSGLNDAKAYLANGGTGFPGCLVPGTPPLGSKANPIDYFTQDLSGGSNTAKYSCITIDSQPTELFTQVSPGQPALLKLSSADNLKNLFIAWQNSSYPCGGIQWLPGGSNLPAEDSVENCVLNKDATGVLRVGLYEIPNSAATSCNINTNNCLSSRSSVYYLYPNRGGGTPGSVIYSENNYNINTSGPTGNNGIFVMGNCNSSRSQYCNSEIQNLVGASNTYYLYLTAQYAPVNVSVQGKTATGKEVEFQGSQATVDVTGQSSGVIQRIQAKVNIGSNFGLPNYGVQSMETLCKNFYVEIGTSPTQYGSAAVKENPDKACFAPAGFGNIVGPASDLYKNGH